MSVHCVSSMTEGKVYMYFWKLEVKSRMYQTNLVGTKFAKKIKN